MKPATVIIVLLTLFVFGFLFLFERNVVVPERTACNERGGVYFEGRGGYYCLRKDAVIDVSDARSK